MRTVISIVAGLGVLYVGMTALLAISQRNLLYRPSPVDNALATRYRAAEIRIDVPGATLSGWYLGHSDPSAPVVIYFGGNGDEASWYLPRFARMTCCAALLVNYRGYGNSTGNTNEAALRADALALYDAAQRLRPTPGLTVLFGRSLGTGMAVSAGASRPGTPLVLISPYDSIAEVAQTAFPFFPVRWLLQDKYECSSYAGKLTAPALAFVAETDAVIERKRSDALLRELNGEVELHVVPDADHNSIVARDAVWQRIDDWIRELPRSV